MNEVSRAVLRQMLEEATAAEAELRQHIETTYPDVGKCPQRRADAEAWLCMVEVGGPDAD
jgi:hypothetical protein